MHRPNPTWRFMALSRVISRITILFAHIRGLMIPHITKYQSQSAVDRS